MIESDAKMVCLDVDGTLVDHDGHMSPRVREAAQAVIARGHHVMIATGRSLGATLPVIENIGLTDGFSVCSNGGVTLQLGSEFDRGYQVIDRQTFDPAPVLGQVKRRIPSAKFAIETESGAFLSTERFQDFSFGVRARGVSFQDLCEATAVRLVVFSQDSSVEEFGEAVESIGLTSVAYSVGYNAWLDVAAAGISKASGLEALREKLGIDQDQTVAVGDGYNDTEMLAWAHRGVAMGQAPERVKRIANEVTEHVNDDGLALVLESLL
ncbi:HAD family hydrolase [Auritidibacter ignavus]|uniref:HAD family hydrolase n=1 Tax=Auritidibacter ignavus TaxID=678932 RepID=UPI0021039130|nr:HAD family hydrolase [Auritidibacter ignavus]